MEQKYHNLRIMWPITTGNRNIPDEMTNYFLMWQLKKISRKIGNFLSVVAKNTG
jgi:hypothetical protein